MDIKARIATTISAELAKPKTHRVVMQYADGSEKFLDQNNLKSANNYAKMMAAQVGKTLKSRETGEPVRMTSIKVIAL